MKSINAFLEKNFKFIVLGFFVILFLRTCNSDTKSINKRLDNLTQEVQILKDTVVTKTDLEIEGLRAEKRMIQATDRKMLDVQRQTQIDNEIKRLQGR
jgi:low affinity Fe/Cu permease